MRPMFHSSSSNFPFSFWSGSVFASSFSLLFQIICQRWTRRRCCISIIFLHNVVIFHTDAKNWSPRPLSFPSTWSSRLGDGINKKTYIYSLWNELSPKNIFFHNFLLTVILGRVKGKLQIGSKCSEGKWHKSKSMKNASSATLWIIFRGNNGSMKKPKCLKTGEKRKKMCQ